MFGKVSIRFWPRLYKRANAESYKDLGDKNQRVQEGQYFMVLTSNETLMASCTSKKKKDFFYSRKV